MKHSSQSRRRVVGGNRSWQSWRPCALLDPSTTTPRECSSGRFWAVKVVQGNYIRYAPWISRHPCIEPFSGLVTLFLEEERMLVSPASFNSLKLMVCSGSATPSMTFLPYERSIAANDSGSTSGVFLRPEAPEEWGNTSKSSLDSSEPVDSLLEKQKAC